MDKKGRNEIEKAITLIFGCVIFIVFVIILFSSGIVSDIFKAFSIFGSLGILLSILFILMIVFAIWEALTKKR